MTERPDAYIHWTCDSCRLRRIISCYDLTHIVDVYMPAGWRTHPRPRLETAILCRECWEKETKQCLDASTG